MVWEDKIALMVIRGDTPEAIGSRFRALRKALGLNQTQMADDLGLTQSHISMLERGERPLEQHVAKRMIQLWKLDYNWIYDGDPEGLPKRLYDVIYAGAPVPPTPRRAAS